MKKHLKLSMSWLLCVAMLFGLGAPVYAAADTTAPVVKDMCIVNPKTSYTEGDEIYFNLLVEEDSDLDYVYIYFKIDGVTTLLSAKLVSYDSVTNIASCKLFIDDSVSSGIWNFYCVDIRDYYNNSKSYYSKDFNAVTVDALSIEVVGNIADITAPVVKDVYITNPKTSYTEGDEIYFNLLVEEDSDLDYAYIYFKIDGVTTLLSAKLVSYDSVINIASCKLFIDDSVSSGIWNFYCVDIRDHYNNSKSYYSKDFDTVTVDALSIKIGNSEENNNPYTPDDFLTYDWTGCVGLTPTVSLTSSTNELYTMVVLPGSASSDVTITHTGSSSIVIGSWGQFTEGYQLTFPAPGVYKLKFIQNVTKNSLYYYANITDHEVGAYTENEGLKIATCKTCGTTFEQVGTPSWRVENNKLIGTEYTTGQVMIALYEENGHLINAKYCEKSDVIIIDGATLYRYIAPDFTKSELQQAKRILCFSFTEQTVPVRDVIKVLKTNSR